MKSAVKTGLLHVLLLRFLSWDTHGHSLRPLQSGPRLHKPLVKGMQSLNLPELSCGPSRKSRGTPSESHLRNRINEGKPCNHKVRNRVNPNCLWKKTEAFSHYFLHCLKCFSLSVTLRNTIMIETAQPLTTKLMGGPDHSQSSKKALTFSKTPEMLACLHPTSIDGNLKTPLQAATPATDNIMSAWQMIAYNMSRMWSVPMARNVLHAFLSSEIRDG